MRSWLNDEFIETAFRTEEQKLLAETKLENKDNHEYGTDGGKDTVDKVFLLSIDEIKKYFSLDDIRKCEPTEYTVVKGVYIDDNGSCWWWLRSPGENQRCAVRVFYGKVRTDGLGVDGFNGAIRPAMWVSIE